MLRRLFLSSLAVLGAVASAAAADLPAEKGPPVYAPPPPVFSWTGIYVGANLGGAWDYTSYTGNNIGFVRHNGSGVIGGGEVGARYQFSQFVIGAEGSFDGSNLGDTQFSAGGSERLGVKEIYTATGQAGVAWDRWYIYGKGGWAGSYNNLLATNAVGFGSNNFHTGGWTVGAGVAYSILPNVNVGLEYDHFDLGYGPATVPWSNGGAPYVRTGGHEYIDQVVGRLEYKFDWFAAPPPPPVVAKY